MTITGYVYYSADKYSGAIPTLLDKTIIDEMLALLSYGAIELFETKQRANHEFDLSGSDQ